MCTVQPKSLSNSNFKMLYGDERTDQANRPKQQHEVLFDRLVSVADSMQFTAYQ